MPLRFPTLCAVAALAVGLAACAGPSEPGRTAAADRPTNASTADALARIARQSLEAGDPVSAVSMLKRAHEIDPKSPAILADLGRNLGALKAWSEAAEAYRKAAALAPNDAAIRRGYGGALLALDQPVLAEQEYRAAIAVREDAATLCALGVTLDLQARHDEAEAAFRKAYQLDPQSAATRANLALSLALWGSSDEAIGLLAPMAAAPDAAARQRQNLALVFGLAGERDQAAAVARIDLGDEAVRSNLSYYETLRALPPVLRVRAIMGAHDAEPPLPPRKPELAAADVPAPVAAPAPAATPQPSKHTPAKTPRTAERRAPVADKMAAKKPASSRIPFPAIAKAEPKMDAAKTEAIVSRMEIENAVEPEPVPADAVLATTAAPTPAIADAPAAVAESPKAEAEATPVVPPAVATTEDSTAPALVAGEQAEEAASAVDTAPSDSDHAAAAPNDSVKPEQRGTAEVPTPLPEAKAEAQSEPAAALVEATPHAGEPAAAEPNEPAEPSSHEVAEAPTPLLPPTKTGIQLEPEVSAPELERTAEPAIVMVPASADVVAPLEATP